MPSGLSIAEKKVKIMSVIKQRSINESKIISGVGVTSESAKLTLTGTARAV
jgi:hypothetical protein